MSGCGRSGADLAGETTTTTDWPSEASPRPRPQIVRVRVQSTFATCPQTDGDRDLSASSPWLQFIRGHVESTSAHNPNFSPVRSCDQSASVLQPRKSQIDVGSFMPISWVTKLDVAVAGLCLRPVPTTNPLMPRPAGGQA